MDPYRDGIRSGMWVMFVQSAVCSVFGSVFAVVVGKGRGMLVIALGIPGVHELKAVEEPVLGNSCKEPCKVLIVKLVCVSGAGCLLDESGKLSQLAGSVSIPKSLWAGLAAN